MLNLPLNPNSWPRCKTTAGGGKAEEEIQRGEWREGQKSRSHTAINGRTLGLGRDRRRACALCSLIKSILSEKVKTFLR